MFSCLDPVKHVCQKHWYTGCQRSVKKLTTVHGFCFYQTLEINTVFIITFICTQETKCSLFCFVWGSSRVNYSLPILLCSLGCATVIVATSYISMWIPILLGFGIFSPSAGSSYSHPNPLLIHRPTTQNTNWPLSLGLLAKHASTLKKSDLYC